MFRFPETKQKFLSQFQTHIDHREISFEMDTRLLKQVTISACKDLAKNSKYFSLQSK